VHLASFVLWWVRPKHDGTINRQMLRDEVISEAPKLVSVSNIMGVECTFSWSFLPRVGSVKSPLRRGLLWQMSVPNADFLRSSQEISLVTAG
jgi:hypothetical protein